jgi:hypothetical protein
MARTTSTPHKVSRNKSGTPIVRASKLFPGRPKRTTRETAFKTEQQAMIFAEALNLALLRLRTIWTPGVAVATLSNPPQQRRHAGRSKCLYPASNCRSGDLQLGEEISVSGFADCFLDSVVVGPSRVESFHLERIGRRM